MLLACGFALPATAQGPGNWGPRYQGNAPGPADNASPALPPAPIPADVFPAAPAGPEKTFIYSRQAIRPAAPAPAPTPAPEKTFFYTRQPAPPAGLPPVSRRTALQPGKQPSLRPPAQAQEIPEYNIRLDVPGLQRLSGQLESEAALMERMRQEARARGERLIFPEEPTLAREPYLGRNWSPLTRVVEPYYVSYGRLLFQQKNFERYGWDLGPISPLLSAGKFYLDVLALPYHVGTRPYQQYEVSAGYCLPGDPVPLLLYPPEVSVTGLMAEAAVVTALFFIFP